jgi:type IV pilus assembly protein PilE
MSKLSGFTLIELMIVVAIVAVLAAIAIPSYTQYVVRANRAEATSALLSEASAQQRFFTNNNKFSDKLLTKDTTENGYYKLTINRPDNFTYTLTATPQGNQATRDTKCASFTLTHTGQKGVTGTDPVNKCW